MSVFEGLPEVEAGLGDVLSLLGIAKDESLSEEVNRLYKEADALAVFTVKVTIALFWWAAHIGSATSDALGYSAQIQAAMATANKYELEAWQEFLRVKHPTEIRRVYIRTTKRIEVTKRVMAKAQRVNLKPILKRLAALEHWRKHTVTPALRNWTNFYRLWRSTYRPAVLTVVRWRRKPSTFASWAIGPLIVAAPKALRRTAAKRSATAIEAALVATWQNDPSTIYNSVLEWLVTK